MKYYIDYALYAPLVITPLPPVQTFNQKMNMKEHLWAFEWMM